MVKLDAVINNKKFVDSVQKGVDSFNRSTAGRNKLKLKIDERGFRQPLGRITGDLDKFESALAASNARVIAFGASTAVIGGMTRAFKELAATTINVQKQFADINRILGISNKQFEQFSSSLFDLSKKTATGFDDAAKGALEFARQGLSLNEVLSRTHDALTLVRLTGVNADKAVSALTATVNAFQQSSLTTTEALNKFVAVETKFAVSARDLMEGLGRVGSAAVDAKVDFNELNAMIAAVQQQTGRGGAVIGNALKTIFTRLQRTDTLTALESYGVAVRDVEGSTRPAMSILQDFAKTYDGLADSSKAYLREQVAGVFQANILSAIVKDLNSNTQVYNRALDTSVQATNEADLANARLNKTLSALISQTGTELVRLQENVGKVTFEPIARGLLAPFKDLVEGANNIIDGEGLGSDLANGVLKGIRNVLAGPGLVAALAVVGTAFIKTVGYITKALPTLVGITTETQKRAQLEASITAMLANDAALSQQVAAATGNAATQAGILMGAAQKAETAFKSQAATTKAIADNLLRAGMTTNKMGALTPSGRGAFGRGASGYVPGMGAEASDIRRGVGGVSTGSRPVHIPNFAFGNGMRGSMVANTGEYVVPNFAQGGSAIFNPDMVRANGGLPQGAKRITAAHGYVPNFSPPAAYTAGMSIINSAKSGGSLAGWNTHRDTLRSAGQNSWADKLEKARTNVGSKRAASQQKAKTKDLFSFTGDNLGIGAVVGMAKRKPPYDTSTGFAQILASKSGAKVADPELLAYMNAHKHKRVAFSNIAVGALNHLGTSPDADAKLEQKFSKKLNKFMLPALNNYSASIFGTLLGDDGRGFIKQLKKNKKRVFSTAVEGGIFEGALQLASRKSSSFSGDDMARFDFEEGGTISPVLKDAFFAGRPVLRADAKRSDTPENLRTLISKAFGTPATAKIIKGGMAPDIAKWRQRQSARAARGFVPNFAGGLGAALQREKASGVPSSAIRIHSSPRFKSPQNPTGLAVTNKIDEPRGLRDVPNFTAAIPPEFRHLTGSGSGRVPLTPQASGMGGGMAAMGAMMAAPMIGGVAEQAIGGTTGGAISGGLTGATTGAMIGMMGPPVVGPLVGAALGGAIGAIVGFNGAMETAAEGLSSFTGSLQTNLAASDAYVKATQAMNNAEDMDAYRDAMISATDALYQIDDPELRTALQNNKGEFEALTKVLKEYKTEQLKELMLKKAVNRAEEDVGKKVASKYGKALEKDFGGNFLDPNAASAITDEMGERIFSPIMSYFMATDRTNKEVEEIGKAFKTLSGTRGTTIGDMNLFGIGGQRTLTEAREFLSAQKFTTGDRKGKKMFSVDEVEDLAKMFATSLDPGIDYFGDQTATILNDFITTGGLSFLIQRLIKTANEEAENADTKQEAKQNFTSAFKEITSVFDEYIQSSAQILRQEGFALARRQARQSGRASLLGRAVDPFDMALERNLVESQALQVRRANRAQPIINKFGTRVRDSIAVLNQRGGEGKEDREALQAILQTGFLGGNIGGAIGEIQRRLDIPEGEKGAVLKKEDRSKMTTLVRELKDAWGKGGEVLDQEEFIIKQKFQEDTIRKQLLDLELKIVKERQQTVEDEKVNQALLAANLQRTLTTLDLESQDFENIRGLGVVGKGDFVADIEEKKLLARQQFERDQLDSQIAIERAKLDSDEAIMLGTIELVDSNYKLLDAIEELTTAIKDPDKTPADTLGFTTVGPDGKIKTLFDLPSTGHSAALLNTHGGPVRINPQGLGSTLDQDSATLIPGAPGQPLKGGAKIRAQLSARQKQTRQLFNQSVTTRQLNQDIAQGAALGDFDRRRGFNRGEAQKELTFERGFARGMDDVADQGEKIFNVLGTKLPIKLRDGLVGAMEAGLDGAKSIEDAFKDLGIELLRTIRGAFLQRIATNIVGGIPQDKQRGGIIHAQNGLSVPGSGTGDTVAARLEPGEYVLNRRAVAAMGGAKALDNLNFNAAPRFGGPMGINEDPLSSRMSGLYFATGSPELDEIAAKAREAQDKRAAKKAKNRALWTTFATLLASAGVSKVMDVGKERGWASKIGGKFKSAFGGGRTGETHIDAHGSAWSRMPEGQTGGAVHRYGILNSYQSGGAVGGRIGSTNNTNNISISVNAGGGGPDTSANPQQGGEQINQDNGTSAQELTQRIKSAVVQVIADEQRIGGSLSSTSRKGKR